MKRWASRPLRPRCALLLLLAALRPCRCSPTSREAAERARDLVRRARERQRSGGSLQLVLADLREALRLENTHPQCTWAEVSVDVAEDGAG